MKKILSILLILALFLSFIPLNSSLSEEIVLPEGFTFLKNYQRIPVTLDETTYYAYEIEKNDGKQKVTGWFIVDSNNKTVSDQSAYTKLALAATVTKYIEESPTISTIMESDLNMLNNLKWKMALYEVSQSLIKTVSSFLGTATGNIPTGAFEEVVALAASIPQSAAIELSDKYLDEFTNWTANTFYETLIKTGEITGDLDAGANIFKFCGVLQSIIKKGALISAKKGIDSYNESYDIFKNHMGPWSYEDAQKFLEGYTKGKAQAVAYGSWYLRMIPYNSNMWLNIGSTVWDNVVKQVLPAKIEDITNAADVVTKFVPLFIKIVKESPDKLFYNQVEEDIKNMSSLLNIFRLLYNTSIKDSPANKTYSAIVASLTGTISITSSPSGAKVYINGSYEGLTPMTRTMIQGNYTIELTKDGYSNYKTNVNITQNKVNQLNATLAIIKPKNPLIGKWQAFSMFWSSRNTYWFGSGTGWGPLHGYNLILEFFDDGTCIRSFEGYSISGSYRIIDQNRVELKFYGGEVDRVYRFSVSGDVLTIQGLLTGYAGELATKLRRNP